MEDRIKEAYAIIDKVNTHFHNPAIMWSGGKDSMVLLHLIRRVCGSIPFPVIYHREPFFPKKFAFQQRVEEEWGFCAIDYTPSASSLQKSNGVLEIERQYQIGPQKYCRCPISHYEADMKPGEFLCGLTDLLARPTGSFNYPWDVAFIGHKSCDTDLFLGGDIPLHVDIKLNVGAPSLAFPIRHWSHDDVWDYIAEHDVPYDAARYDAETRTERADKTLNSDWFQCCVRCLDKDGPAVVDCPKMGVQVDNISDQFPYTTAPELSYCGKNDTEVQS